MLPNCTVGGFAHASADCALLPIVVKVGVFVCGLKSQGTREALFFTSSSQPATGVPLTDESQHQTSRMSVLGMSHGWPRTAASSGLAGKTFHFGGYGIPGEAASLKTIWPVYVF